jgi:hypothetical protein
MRQTIMGATLKRERGRKVSNVVQMDDAYWNGCRRACMRTRVMLGKMLFFAAVATDAASVESALCA